MQKMLPKNSLPLSEKRKYLLVASITKFTPSQNLSNFVRI